MGEGEGVGASRPPCNMQKEATWRRAGDTDIMAPGEFTSVKPANAIVCELLNLLFSLHFSFLDVNSSPMLFSRN